MPHFTEPTEEVNEYRSVTVRLVTNGTGYNALLDEERNMSYGGVWMEPGETYDMNNKWFYDSGANIALVKGNYEKFNWYSKDTSVATVANGIITAVGEGSTQIMSDLTYPLNAAGVTITVTKSQNEVEEIQTSDTENSGSTIVDATLIDDPGTALVVTGSESVSGGQEPLTEGAATPVTTKQNQTIKVKKSLYTYKYKTLKKKAKKFRIKPTVNNGEAHGIVSYKVVKYPKGGKKYITVDKKGNVTLKKKAKKGTYKIQITVGEIRDMNSATKTITIKVK